MTRSKLYSQSISNEAVLLSVYTDIDQKRITYYDSLCNSNLYYVYRGSVFVYMTQEDPAKFSGYAKYMITVGDNSHYTYILNCSRILRSQKLIMNINQNSVKEEKNWDDEQLVLKQFVVWVTVVVVYWDRIMQYSANMQLKATNFTCCNIF